MIVPIAAVIAAFAGMAAGTAPAPEACMVKPGAVAAASTVYNGRPYFFASIECGEEFLSDPERYSQLYDALSELAASGVPVKPTPADESLVPS